MESIEEIFAAIDECLQKTPQKARVSIAAILNKLSIETQGEDKEVKQKRIEMIDNLREVLLSPPAPAANKPVRFLAFKSEPPFEEIIKRTPLLLFQDEKKNPLDVITPFIPPFNFLLEKMLFGTNAFKNQFMDAAKSIDWERFRLVDCAETIYNVSLAPSDFAVYKDLQKKDMNDMQIEDIYSETNKVKERFKKHVLFAKLFMKYKYLTVSDITSILRSLLGEYFHLLTRDQSLCLVQNEISLSEYKILLFYKAFKFSKKMQTLANPVIADILASNSFYRYKIKSVS